MALSKHPRPYRLTTLFKESVIQAFLPFAETVGDTKLRAYVDGIISYLRDNAHRCSLNGVDLDGQEFYCYRPYRLPAVGPIVVYFTIEIEENDYGEVFEIIVLLKLKREKAH